jgi:hypothetical protein
MDHYQIEAYMSWVPLIGSALGSVLGGILADRLSIDIPNGCARMFLAGIGSLVAAPIVGIALILHSPYCFLILILSGAVSIILSPFLPNYRSVTITFICYNFEGWRTIFWASACHCISVRTISKHPCCFISCSIYLSIHVDRWKYSVTRTISAEDYI